MMEENIEGEKKKKKIFQVGFSYKENKKSRKRNRESDKKTYRLDLIIKKGKEDSQKNN